MLIPFATTASGYHSLQLNHVRCCPDKFLPTMTWKRHFLDIKQTGGNQNINVLLDRASVAMQTMCNSGDGGWISLCCSEQFESCRSHDSKHIRRIFERKSELRLWNLAA